MNTKNTTIDDIRDCIVFTEKVAHVTFYLVKDKYLARYMPEEEKQYLVYSESAKRGLEQVTDYLDSHEDALAVLRVSIQNLEDILESKRKGTPTAKQVYFLFVHKIPIPLTLTWGEASDLIDEKLNQLEYEKQEYFKKKAEKYDGFTVGQRITHQFFHPIRLLPGTITKLTSNGRGARYMYIDYDDGTTCRWPLNGLPKTAEAGAEKEQLRPTVPAKVSEYHAGEQVLHAKFGTGKVLKSEIDGQTEFVEVQFQIGLVGKKRLSMDFAKLEKVETPTP